jgi:hypothetical protein
LGPRGLHEWFGPVRLVALVLLPGAQTQKCLVVPILGVIVCEAPAWRARWMVVAALGFGRPSPEYGGRWGFRHGDWMMVLMVLHWGICLVVGDLAAYRLGLVRLVLRGRGPLRFGLGLL